MLNTVFGCLPHITVVYVSDILEFLFSSIFREETCSVIKCSGYIGRQSLKPIAEGEGASVWFRPMGMVFTKTLASTALCHTAQKSRKWN
jgi:hypothetical protein